MKTQLFEIGGFFIEGSLVFLSTPAMKKFPCTANVWIPNDQNPNYAEIQMEGNSDNFLVILTQLDQFGLIYSFIAIVHHIQFGIL